MTFVKCDLYFSHLLTHVLVFLFQAVGDFAHFEQLRWEDQEKIRQRIEAGPGPGKKSTFFAI
jgi:hypothetical protein